MKISKKNGGSRRETEKMTGKGDKSRDYQKKTKKPNFLPIVEKFHDFCPIYSNFEAE